MHQNISTTVEADTTHSRPRKPPALPPRLGSVTEIRRDQYWPYVTSFEGDWHGMFPDNLETLARINYSSPRPHVIDPGVFFDIARIRCLFTDAFATIVLLCTGKKFKVPGTQSNTTDDETDASDTRVSRPSKHSKYALEVLALEKLYKAWILDDTAACVAGSRMIPFLQNTVQTYEQRRPEDPRAEYVSFFCKRIATEKPSIVENAERLERLLDGDFQDPSVLRTKASACAFVHAYEDALNDYNAALDCFEEGAKYQRKCDARVKSSAFSGLEAKSLRDVLKMTDSSKPTGLEMQLYFQRGMIHLDIACENAAIVLDPSDALGYPAGDNDTEWDVDAGREIVEEAFNVVKKHAQAALQDILSFLSKLDYSSGPKPPDTANLQSGSSDPRAIKDKIAGSNRLRHRAIMNLQVESGTETDEDSIAEPSDRNLDPNLSKDQATTTEATEKAASDVPVHRCEKISSLFGTEFASDLPKFPSKERPSAAKSKRHRQSPAARFAEPEYKERVTYHPYLHEALHVLLLCHVLLRTDRHFVRRYAITVARLISLSDRAGIFSTLFYTKSELDWIQIIKETGDWLNLRFPWPFLCQRKARPKPRDPEWDPDRAETLVGWILVGDEVSADEDHESDIMSTTEKDDDPEDISVSDTPTETMLESEGEDTAEYESDSDSEYHSASEDQGGPMIREDDEQEMNDAVITGKDDSLHASECDSDSEDDNFKSKSEFDDAMYFVTRD